MKKKLRWISIVIIVILLLFPIRFKKRANHLTLVNIDGIWDDVNIDYSLIEWVYNPISFGQLFDLRKVSGKINISQGSKIHSLSTFDGVNKSHSWPLLYLNDGIIAIDIFAYDPVSISGSFTKGYISLETELPMPGMPMVFGITEVQMKKVCKS